MKRGRRRSPFGPAYGQLLVEGLEERGLGVCAAARICGLEKGTVSQIYHGKRAAAANERDAFWRWLGIGGPDAEARLRSSEPDPTELVLLDPPVAASPELHRGQEHLIRARYDLAEAEFVGVFNAAEVQQNLRLQADAAGRVSWTLFEQGRYEESDKWFQTSIKLIETYFGTGLKEIIDSVQPGGRSAVLSRTDDTSYVLSRALQIRCRSLTQRLVYCQQYERYREAEEAFAHSLAVDRYLEVPALLGHDLRVYAVLVAAHDDRRHREAQKLLHEAREKFDRGSLGDAYLRREEGVVLWLTRPPREARKPLHGVVDHLVELAENRALGPTCFVVSKSILRDAGYRTEASRAYALAGAVLDPYGFVLDNCNDHILHSDPRSLRRDVDDLRNGKEPLDFVRRVMARLVKDTPITAEDRIEQNLRCVLGRRYAEFSEKAMLRRPPLKSPNAQD